MITHKLTSDIRIVSSATRKQYNIVIGSHPNCDIVLSVNGITYPANENITVDYGSTVAVVVTPALGYQVDDINIE